ncbi:MAG: ABC-2 type transporter [Acetothermia bacterium 64_32]|nr:MAG: ABC-2 type transporter [Acetothermia bacterium 64_32]MBC7097524.1 ABC transporter permease [Candidatus Bipolaricaulota bacterium]HAF70433.1 ABC transporter [Candidatus Acetothermia bacterium]
MTMLSDIWYVAWRELIKFFRAKVRVVVTLIQPLLWLGLMGNVMQGFAKNQYVQQMLGTQSYLAFMTPGIILMTVLFGGVFSGISIIWDRRFGYLEKLMAAPISRGAIPLGKMLAAALQGGIQVLVIILIAMGFGVRFASGPVGILAILLIAMIFSTILSGFSLSMAVTIKTQETLMAIVNFFTMPLMFASNALFPREAMPGWLSAIARVNPVTHAVAPIRELTLHGWDWGAMYTGIAVIVGLALAMGLLAQWMFRRATVE